MMTHTRRAVLALATALAAVLPLGSASAAYPERTVRIIVPFPAGGSTDVVARILAQYFEKELGKTFIVENRSGADGSIGTGAVARSTPDGYTIMVMTNSMAVNPAIFDKLDYDTLKDIASVGLVGDMPNVVVVNKNLPIKNLKDLVEFSKKETVRYGTSASAIRLATERLMRTAGVNAIAVPYKGAGETPTALISGQVHLLLTGVTNALGIIRSGDARPIVLTSETRSSLVPDVPTVREVGIPGYADSVWIGMFVPAGTSPAIIKTLNDTLVKVNGIKEFQDRLASIGVERKPSSAADMDKMLRADLERWAKLSKDLGGFK